MANKEYKVISGYSEQGGTLKIPLSWDINSPDKDLLVYIVGTDGKPKVCDYWTWDSVNSQVCIENKESFAAFGAYVFRNELVGVLAKLTSGGQLRISDFVEQFGNLVRCSEQLAENDKHSIISADSMGGVLPNASSRAGKVLSFDERGNPIVSVEQDDITNIKAYKEAAETAKEEAVAAKQGIEAAQAACETAKTAAQDSADKAKASETKVEQSAQRAAENAQAAGFSKSYAESYANTAQTAATTAEQEATAAIMAKDQAETAQIASETAKTAAEMANTQAQGAKQAAVDAANTATQAAGVQDLRQSKAERGTYYINGGTITSAAFALSAPFTYFITYKAGFVGTLFSKGNTSLTIAASGTLTLTDGTNTATATMDATKDHLIAVEVLATTASLIVDGIATTPTTFAFVDTASAGVVIGGTTTDGKLARPILFNFGISETNAPYAFADYQSGKALSPYLTNAIAKVEDSNLGASTDGGWDITEKPTTTITKGKWTANSGTYIDYLKNRTIGSAETAAGIEYAVDLRSTTILGGGGCLFYNDNALTMYNTGKAVIRAKFKYLKITAVGGTSPYTGLTIAQTSGQNNAIIHLDNGSVSDHNWHEYNQILTANTNAASNANGSRIGLSAGGLASGETGASWSIADFHFEILGALFAPADFVITTGTTRNIPDLSGQGKDATLSGQPATVKTDNDIKVAKLKEYFTANS